MCPSVENLDLVHQETSYNQSPTHFRLSERSSRQAFQTGPDHPNRVVSPSRGFPNNMQQVAQAQDRPICHEVQQQVTSVCVARTGSPGLGSLCTQPAIGGPGCVCLPTSSHFGQSSGEVAGPPLPQDLSDCPRVAQHALVLGSSGHVKPDPSESAHPAQPANSALQSDSTQESDQSKSTPLAPRASAIKELFFSEAVAAQIEAPQRGSTRSVYEVKWTIFTVVPQ